MAINLTALVAGVQGLTEVIDVVGWPEICFHDPSLPECANVGSYYDYRISLPANATFLAIFSLAFIGYVVIYAVTRRGVAFTIALLLGILCEIVGYAGRILSWRNQWDQNAFLMQICCLTIGPAFMAAGLYLCLRRIVYAVGTENSRIPPEWYTRFFIPCDVLSLVLQALGGGMASVAANNNKSVTTGDNIMIAGLSFQVVTMLIYLLCAADMALRTWRRAARLGSTAALSQDADARALRASFWFRGFLAALAIASVCIFWRCVFRVAELAHGWSGPLMKRQDLFIGFEGVMVATAVVVLLAFHPSVCFRAMMEGKGGLGSTKKSRKSRKTMAESDGSVSA